MKIRRLKQDDWPFDGVLMQVVCAGKMPTFPKVEAGKDYYFALVEEARANHGEIGAKKRCLVYILVRQLYVTLLHVSGVTGPTLAPHSLH
jgi:hypothetical protein